MMRKFQGHGERLRNLKSLAACGAEETERRCRGTRPSMCYRCPPFVPSSVVNLFFTEWEYERAVRDIRYHWSTIPSDTEQKPRLVSPTTVWRWYFAQNFNETAFCSFRNAGNITHNWSLDREWQWGTSATALTLKGLRVSECSGHLFALLLDHLWLKYIPLTVNYCIDIFFPQNKLPCCSTGRGGTSPNHWIFDIAAKCYSWWGDRRGYEIW